MTKIVSMYQCELCESIYVSNKEAEQCERLGKELPLATAGDLIEYELKVGGGFNSMFIDLRVRDVEDTGHFIIYSFEENDGKGGWEEASYGVYGEEEFKKLVTIKKIS